MTNHSDIQEAPRGRRKGLEDFTHWEEFANSLTHGIGTVISIVGLVILVLHAVANGTALHITACAVYGATLVILYLSSTLYHSFSHMPRMKHAFKICDHSAIYLLIAGSYTPFTLILLRGGWGWSLFGVVWGLAIAGVCFKAGFVNRFNVISTLVYLAMGWLVVIAIRPLVTVLPPTGLWLLVAGGVAYSLGTLFYGVFRFPFHHAVWHLMVILGSLFHFFAVFFFVVPRG
jgi:hemolysin III